VFWEGGLPFAVAPARDVTKRNRAEAALREREERFRGTFENAAVGIGYLLSGQRVLRIRPGFDAATLQRLLAV
jgi:PAS domain-containing protein